MSRVLASSEGNSRSHRSQVDLSIPHWLHSAPPAALLAPQVLQVQASDDSGASAFEDPPGIALRMISTTEIAIAAVMASVRVEIGSASIMSPFDFNIIKPIEVFF
jgi:hypothetical protein